MRKSVKRVAVIATRDPEEFERQVNEKLEELSDRKPDVMYDITNDFHALISYEETIEEVRTVEDEFLAEGIRYVCGQCPFREQPEDKRRKNVSCVYSDLGQTHLDMSSCEVFYRAVKRGDVEPMDYRSSKRKLVPTCSSDVDY